MKIKAVEKFAKQLNAKELKPEGNIFQFIECKEHITKKNNTIQAIYLLGTQGEFIGDFFVPIFRIKNIKELLAKFGDDDTAMKDKLFTLICAGDEVIFKW